VPGTRVVSTVPTTMAKISLHLAVCIVLTVVAAVVCPVYFGWPPRLGPILQGLAEPTAWSTLLFVAFASAWASWRQRAAPTVRRALLRGFVWGLGIGALGALLGCLVASATPAPHPGLLSKVLGCWAVMSLFMAPYVALWLAGFCAWVRWRNA
jgi:hypothetical protein